MWMFPDVLRYSMHVPEPRSSRQRVYSARTGTQIKKVDGLDSA